MSIRAKLSIAFGCLFGAIVVALAISSYVIEKADAFERLDAALRVASGATAMAAEHELNEHPNPNAGERDLQSVLDESNSSALSDTEILVCQGTRQAAYRRVAQYNINLCQDATPAHAPLFRFSSVTLAVPKFTATYHIYAVKPITPVLAQLQNIRLALLLILPAGLALAGFAGYLLARRYLRPLGELASTIDSLNSSDLTARVHVPSQMDEVSRLGLRFNRLLDRLDQAFSVQRRFMADASHQIRTPVTVSLAAAQVISRDPSSDLRDCKESLQIVEQQMLQLRRTVDDMFFLSQADTASLNVEMREIYFDDLVADAVRSARPLAAAKFQTIKFFAPPEARCIGDEELLRQAILILLDNAVKYSPSGSHVEVALFERANSWVCSVSDDGPGISPAAQSQIFERFFRENRPSGQKLIGAGLGLAIAKSIVETHSGTLSLVASAPGRTTFEISIPVPAVIAGPETAQANSLTVKI